MTPPEAATPSFAAERVLSAISRDDRPAAEAALSAISGEVAAAALLAAADVLMRRLEWSRAAWLLSKLPDAGQDVGTQMKRRFSANLAALQCHRPDVYDVLVALPAQHQFSVAATASGPPTVQYRRLDGTVVSLSGGPDPLAAAAAALAQLYGQTKSGEAVGLCGLGDGYLLHLLAQRPPALFMDKRQAVYVVEPEPHVLLHCLMIHDYAGAAGPIEDGRFCWFVGADWGERLERAVLRDAYLPPPAVLVGQGFDAQRIQARLRTTVQRVVDRDADLAAAVERYYATLAPAALADLFGGAGGRPPRVLLLTTRFSTVLQFSTRDTAAAFERLGWEAKVVIEPSPYHRVSRGAIVSALAEFCPDLVFQIDHHRHEHHALFPPNLPFACWVQNHLPHLTSQDVGRRVGGLDFVLTDAIATYVDKFAYPPRQCVPLPKLVVQADPPAPPAPGEPADDLVFVSNASATAEAMTAEALQRYARTTQTRELITQCCRRIVAAYERGESLPTYNHVCGVLRGALSDLGLSLAPQGFDVLARWLTHPFNDALYRQQALRWAAAAAREQELSLALYGRGWDAHPEFKAYARGPVEYGEPIRRLTRASRINLQIVPYLCLHQRLLDGLTAGGFFLVRTHPADVAPAALLRFLNAHGGGRWRTTGDAEAALRADLRPEMNRLVERCRPCLCTTGAEDVVAMVRAWEEAGQLTADDGPLPMLQEVSFHDAASLAERTKKFAQWPLLRESIVEQQRRSVGARLGYDAGIRRVVARMRARLAETAAAAPQDAIVEARLRAA